MNKFIASVAAAVLGIVLTAMPPVSGQVQQEVPLTNTTIHIGSCMPITGVLDKRAKQLISGARIYFSSVNDAGGINGRKIVFSVCDDYYEPEKAISCFNTCLKNKVFAGFLFLGSAAIAKYVRMADVDQLPMFGFITGTPVVYDLHPTQFTIRPSIPEEVAAAVNEACQMRGLKPCPLII